MLTALFSPVSTWNPSGSPGESTRVVANSTAPEGRSYSPTPFHNPEARSARPVHVSTHLLGLTRSLRNTPKSKTCGQLEAQSLYGWVISVSVQSCSHAWSKLLIPVKEGYYSG